MKIAYIANIRLPTEKAHGLQIMEMCRAFARNGHRVRLIIPRRAKRAALSAWEYYGMPPEFEIVEISIFDFISFDRWLGRAALWLNTVQFMILGKRAVRLFHPDIVYSRDPWFAPLAPSGSKYLYEAHDFSKTITPVHRWFWKRASRIVVVTSGLKRMFCNEGVPEERLVVAHDGVDPAIFVISETREEARTALNLPTSNFLAVYTGHLYPYKGADDLLEACSHLLANIHVVFVGGRVDDLTRLKARAAALDVKNVTFAGRVPHTVIPLYLRAADAAVLPTRAADRHASEFLSPLKLFEYLAAGKAIIATDLPSIREILDERSAVFVPPGDSVALAQALNNLTVAPERRASLERESFKHVRGHSWVQRAEHILSGITEASLFQAWYRRYRMELLLAGFAFVLRAVYVTLFPQVKITGGDGEIYLGLSDLVRGFRDQVPNAPTFYPIFYPYFLATLRSVFGDALVWIRLAQSLFSAGTVFLMAVMARHWLGRKAAFAAGMLGALYLPMIFESGTIYTETVYTFFLTASVGAAVWAVRSGRSRPAACAGIAFVLAGLTRELGFYQAALFALWAGIARRSWKLAALILVPTLLALGAVAFRNAAIAEHRGLDSQPLVAKRYEAAFTEPTLARFLFAPNRWHLYVEGTYLYFRFPFRLSNIGSGIPIDGKTHPAGEVVYHLNPRELIASQPWPQVIVKVTLVLLHWLLLLGAAYGLWRGRLAKEAKIGFLIAIVFAFVTIMFQGVHRLQGFEGLEPLARYRFPTEPLMILLAVAGAQAVRTARKH